MLYVENALKWNSLVEDKLNLFQDIVWIDNYKNIFDKKFPLGKREKIIIFAKLRWNCLTKAPEDYWHEKNSYFFKNTLNCIFDCRYCYLKWAFKNDFPVYFFNYSDMKKEIEEKIKLEQNINKLMPNFDWKLWFYSSDYSDNLAMNWISNFVEEFVPFFDNFENIWMEIRTKSINIKPILDLWFIPQNTEIAFSLNPEVLINKYEKWVANLKDRIKTVNFLLEKGYKVWLRFLPLLPVKNYKQIYDDFLEYVKKEIDFSKLYSVFASGLLYTEADYLKLLEKDPYFDVLYYLNKYWDGFVREKDEVRLRFYNKFKNIRTDTMICLDEIWN